MDVKMELYGNVIHLQPATCRCVCCEASVAHVVLPISKLAKSEDFVYKIIFMLVLVCSSQLGSSTVNMTYEYLQNIRLIVTQSEAFDTLTEQRETQVVRAVGCLDSGGGGLKIFSSIHRPTHPHRREDFSSQSNGT